ncbi:MAG: hypothetical protein ATN36_06720 [Epulopiscium sp. Nele67-Bin005]|nr:MAG: hypothetical protein ATN36_06720 [Epulopiscium sp. Nele67-Bin005]
MATITQQIIELLDILPEEEQTLAYEFLKRMVLAWDPDFVKLTPFEEIQLTQAMQSVEDGELYTDEDINWD